MPAHTCCAWCQGDVHVVTSLVPASITTPEAFLARFGGLPARQAGMEVLCARPAPEAALAAVIADMQARGAQAYHPTGQVRSTPDYTADYRVWLVTYREVPHGA